MGTKEPVAVGHTKQYPSTYSRTCVMSHRLPLLKVDILAADEETQQEWEVEYDVRPLDSHEVKNCLSK